MTHPTDPTKIFTRGCPICNGPGVMERSSSIVAESLGSDDLTKYWSGFFKQRIFFSYLRCAECHLLFNGSYFTPSALSDMYSSMSDNTAGQPLALMQATQAGYFRMLASSGEVRGVYAEIGPDIGLFTKLAAATNRITAFHLWEPNRKVHEQLKLSVGSTPCHLYTDLATLSDIEDSSIDLVVMIHVLDHLLDPLGFLKQLRRKMKNGGHIFIVTHNEASLLAKVLGRRWPAYCLQHPQLFSPSSMQAILKEAGFDTKKIEKTKNYFPAIYLLKHALWAVGLRIPLPGWSFPVLPLKLGNMGTIGQCREL